MGLFLIWMFTGFPSISVESSSVLLSVDPLSSFLGSSLGCSCLLNAGSLSTSVTSVDLIVMSKLWMLGAGSPSANISLQLPLVSLCHTPLCSVTGIPLLRFRSSLLQKTWNSFPILLSLLYTSTLVILEFGQVTKSSSGVRSATDSVLLLAILINKVESNVTVGLAGWH